jgi:hypothetical protein
LSAKSSLYAIRWTAHYNDTDKVINGKALCFDQGFSGSLPVRPDRRRLAARGYLKTPGCLCSPSPCAYSKPNWLWIAGGRQKYGNAVAAVKLLSHSVSIRHL